MRWIRSASSGYSSDGVHVRALPDSQELQEHRSPPPQYLPTRMAALSETAWDPWGAVAQATYTARELWTLASECGAREARCRAPRSQWRALARSRVSCVPCSACSQIRLTVLQIQVSARGQSPQKRIQRPTREILKPLTRVRCKRRPCGATVRCSLCC